MDAQAEVKVTMSSPSVTETTPPPILTENIEVKLEFDASLSEDERRFYVKAYPSVEMVRDRKVHCTVCKLHLGTAPNMDNEIKMHPILRVTHCPKCHDFYNSGEFSKGEDGSELYCRWCGQGGEVYCCANCPYVFCKSCIVKNLSRGVVADIEQNENWSCFSCAPKILWPLRAQHWALMNYIEKQKKTILGLSFPESEVKKLMETDRSTCCRLSKDKPTNISETVEIVDCMSSRRSQSSYTSIPVAVKKPLKPSQALAECPAAKRPKTSNDEVVCTPDLLSMLEPDCQITVSSQARQVPTPSATTPRVMSIQPGYRSASAVKSNNSTPPPLVLRNTSVQMRPVDAASITRRTVVGPRPLNPVSSNTPVYHTINGYRIDLNSAAQQDTFRLPNGKLIQVKRQGTQQQPVHNTNWQQRTPAAVQQLNSARPVQISQATPQSRYQTITIQPPSSSSHMPQPTPQVMRYHNSTITSNGSGPISINGTPTAPIQSVHSIPRPLMVRHTFPDTAIGQARSQLQDQVFGASDICHHLTSKVQTLTNSNAYKQAHSYLDIKELYIHLSYLLTYAIGRFKGLQDKCLGDMRQLGFVNDADSLENGQLAAGVDYVRYGKLDDVDLYNTGSNSFHNQVYEYRKNLHASLDEGEDGSPKEPLSPLMPLGGIDDDNTENGDDDLKTYDRTKTDNYDDTQEVDEDDAEAEAEVDADVDDTYFDDDQLDDGEPDGEGDEEEDLYAGHHIFGSSAESDMRRSTEEYMSREEESHSFDRKLTRLIEQYPSIWCTRHPDYGNFDVTRKQWRTVAAHFKRTDNIKLRWKNIRKRYVRIERRLRDGKRFSGYFDKATNFLANRDLPLDQWISVDRGASDGDVYKRDELDAVEQKLYPKRNLKEETSSHRQRPDKPIELRPLDVKIINFVKCHPMLWRRSNDPLSNKIEEQTRRSLWLHLTKSAPSYNCDDIIDRWMHLYEMYKTFRLKTIKDVSILANLELKYSKYLAKLYFLYKIDEEDLRNENSTFEDCGALDETPANDTKLQDMPDDKEFVLRVVQMVRKYPSLWNTRHVDYHDTVQRNRLWNEIKSKLCEFQRDVETIKLRWQLARFSYLSLRRDRHKLSYNAATLKYTKNLPAEEMTFLDI